MSHSASYPRSSPTAKHDILCSNSIVDAIHNGGGNATTSSNANAAIDPIDSIDALTSSIVQSAIPVSSMPSDIVKLTTVYTYPDAPTKPKQLSRSPRIWRLVHRSLFEECTNYKNNHDNATSSSGLMKNCQIAVKLPSHIPSGDVKSIKYTKFFYNFIQYLHTHSLVAILACDSAGRIGFIAPMLPSSSSSSNNVGGGGGGDEDYAASLWYAPMKEFLPWAKSNYANLQQEETHPAEPETWTPQYTPPREEYCEPCGWENTAEGDEPETWTPQYTPPPEEECGPVGWEDHHVDAIIEDGGTTGLFVPPSNGNDDDDDEGTSGLFVPSSNNDDHGGFGNGEWDTNNNDDGTAGLFVPNSNNDDNDEGWGNDNGGWDTNADWGNTTDNNTNDDQPTNNADENTGLGTWTNTTAAEDADMKDGVFHANDGAAAADAFYSGLTRSLNTRADSRLYHMRSFNGWVKATQIAELDPDTSSRTGSTGGKKRSRISPMRVLDLACGKGGDLGKWTIHPRKLENYVGVDVARGSLIDAAIRVRQMSKRGNKNMRKCTFTLADLGEDVPGRTRSKRAKRMQELLTWNIQDETKEEQEYDPKFVAREGGGIVETDKFDVVSIQFAIHYMMQTRKRARRFFHTVSSLLEVGGNLIATTIDARVVVEKLMGLGLDYHFDEFDAHCDVDQPENEERHASGNKKRKVSGEEGATVTVGRGVCRLKFDADMLRKVFNPPKSSEDMFGLQYTFTLSEGSDHAAGVGEAVDLPEWLTPVPALEELAEESGLKLEYVSCACAYF